MHLIWMLLNQVALATDEDGYIKKLQLKLQLVIIKYMYGHIILTPSY